MTHLRPLSSLMHNFKTYGLCVFSLFISLEIKLNSAPIDQTLAELGNNSYQVRKAALAELIQLTQKSASTAIPTLVEAYKKSDDPEVKHNIKTTLSVVVPQVLYTPKAFLGVHLSPIHIENHEFIIIAELVQGASADQAGIMANSIILEVDQQKISQTFNVHEFIDLIAKKRAGDFVKLKLKTPKGKTQSMQVSLSARPHRPSTSSIEKQKTIFWESWVRQNL